MENFKKKFIEEALDHINDIEVAILELEKDVTDKALIEKIFRAMHSLKGGGAMFGFEKVSEFTHHLENIYDSIRNGEILVDKLLLELTFKSIDHLKTLFDTDVADEKQINNNQKLLLLELEQFLSDSTVSEKSSTLHNETSKEANNQTLNTYYIKYAPKATIFDTGTNPLF
ncbi:MAG: Hpt domain-containing protein [Bacteroidales bacterium]|nr:Hpt domain-containing protein [Bacteroidales bacterium]